MTKNNTVYNNEGKSHAARRKIKTIRNIHPQPPTEKQLEDQKDDDGDIKFRPVREPRLISKMGLLCEIYRKRHYFMHDEKQNASKPYTDTHDRLIDIRNSTWEQ